MIAQSPGPLSQHFGKIIETISRKENVEPVLEDDDDDVFNETPGNIVVKEEQFIQDDDVINETPENIVVKEEQFIQDDENIVVVEDADIEESCVSNNLDTEENEENTEENTEENAEENIKNANTEDDAEDDIIYYKDAQVEYKFGDLRKENGVYFAPLKKPVMIQTPVLRLKEPISGISTMLKVSGGFAKFVKSHEENILSITKANKTKWFKDDIEDDVLESGFKSFLDVDQLKVKISDDFASFDTDGDFIDSTFCTPAEVRCILKISGVWFGSVEFGSIMSLVQTQLVKLPKCSIKTDREKKNYNYAKEFA
jgi:hypothetical protein